MSPPPAAERGKGGRADVRQVEVLQTVALMTGKLAKSGGSEKVSDVR